MTPLLPLASRRKERGVPDSFTGHLMTGGYPGCQLLLDRIAGVGQCRQYVMRRACAVQKPGPGGRPGPRQHRPSRRGGA
ncbi:MAG TPA: hypothetical protein VGG75_29820 [Trebonia sp.]